MNNNYSKQLGDISVMLKELSETTSGLINVNHAALLILKVEEIDEEKTLDGGTPMWHLCMFSDGSWHLTSPAFINEEGNHVGRRTMFPNSGLKDLVSTLDSFGHGGLLFDKPEFVADKSWVD